MGVGESGKGLPLTSQGGQPQLLDPVHAHLPELWSPRESKACTPPGTPLPDLPWEAGQQPVPRKGLGHPRPTSSSGASRSTPSRQRARGSRRDRSRQVRCCWKADLPLSPLQTGHFPPPPITTDRSFASAFHLYHPATAAFNIIIITIHSPGPRGYCVPGNSHDDQKP